MSQHRKHPIYTVRNKLSGCGHQHSGPAAAVGCARNMFRAQRGTEELVIVKVTRLEQNKSVHTFEEIVARVTARQPAEVS